jgi:hypothetical protein
MMAITCDIFIGYRMSHPQLCIYNEIIQNRLRLSPKKR